MKLIEDLKMVNVEEASRILEVSKKTVTRLCHQEGGLPYYKIGNQFRFALKDIIYFKTNNR